MIFMLKALANLAILGKRVDESFFHIGDMSEWALGGGVPIPWSNSSKATQPNPDLSSFERWLADNTDTPGARLVHLLREHLHDKPGSEAARIASCRSRTGSEIVRCFSGSHLFEDALHRGVPIRDT
jgi:hypothetical protein